MLDAHVGETLDLDVVHEAKVESTELSVGITCCGLMFDLEQFAPKIPPVSMTGKLVVAREVATAPSCLQCIVGL